MDYLGNRIGNFFFQNVVMSQENTLTHPAWQLIQFGFLPRRLDDNWSGDKRRKAVPGQTVYYDWSPPSGVRHHSSHSSPFGKCAENLISRARDLASKYRIHVFFSSL